MCWWLRGPAQGIGHRPGQHPQAACQLCLGSAASAAGYHSGEWGEEGEEAGRQRQSPAHMEVTGNRGGGLGALIHEELSHLTLSRLRLLPEEPRKQPKMWEEWAGERKGKVDVARSKDEESPASLFKSRLTPFLLSSFLLPSFHADVIRKAKS